MKRGEKIYASFRGAKRAFRRFQAVVDGDTREPLVMKRDGVPVKDPKTLLIIGNRVCYSGLTRLHSDARIVHLTDHFWQSNFTLEALTKKAEEEIFALVAESINGEGLDQFILANHGNTNSLFPTGLAGGGINAKDFLREFHRVQMRENHHVCRIVLSGCRVFSGLSPTDVEEYIDLAQMLKSDIVASVTKMSDGEGGFFINIGSDGKVRFDWLNMDSNSVEGALMSDNIFSKAEDDKCSGGWIDNYLEKGEIEKLAQRTVANRKSLPLRVLAAL